MQLLISWIILSFAVYITAYILPGVSVPGIFPTVVTAMCIGIINTFLRPVLLILTLPVNILTLGLFTFVINALLILLVSAIVPEFKVDSFWWAMAFSIILSLVNGFLSAVLRSDR
jgi:putative membrane protein